MRPVPRSRRAVCALLSGSVLGVLVSGCGGGPSRTAPTGVDRLEIPRPVPAPQDFVARPDGNAWFPLESGRSWSYRWESGPGRLEVRVLPSAAGAAEVAGVPVVRVRTTVVGPRPVSGLGRVTTESYAEDREGNLWLFARRTSPRADGDFAVGKGTDAAGLAVPAAPRRGDGYVRVPAAEDGPRRQPREVVAVESTDAVRDVAGTERRDLVLLTVGDPDRARSLVYLQRGVGPVAVAWFGGSPATALLARSS